MTEFDGATRREFRHKLGSSIMQVQNDYRKFPVEVMMPELLAALLSFTAYVSRHNAGLSSYKYQVACEAARQEQWPDNPEEIEK
jgi:hypothetical protein